MVYNAQLAGAPPRRTMRSRRTVSVCWLRAAQVLSALCCAYSCAILRTRVYHGHECVRASIYIYIKYKRAHETYDLVDIRLVLWT